MMNALPAGTYRADVAITAAIGYVEVRHGPQDGHQRLYRVAVDDRPVLFEVLGGEAALVDDSGGA